jgi:predicted Fe-Mo cluster-binding NifX family protein
LANKSVDAVQGAGIAAAQLMAEHQVDAVLTGKLGPKAQAALSAAGIAMHEGLGRCTVAEALAAFRAKAASTEGGAALASAASAVPPALSSGRGQVGGRGCGRCGGGSGRGGGRGRR